MELHFSPGVKGCEEDRNVPTGFGFRPASAEVSTLPGHNCPVCWGPGDMANATSQAPRCSARLCAIQSLAARVRLAFLSACGMYELCSLLTPRVCRVVSESAGVLLGSAGLGDPRLESALGQCSQRPCACRCQCFLPAERGQES